jgi:hypothetical protein
VPAAAVIRKRQALFVINGSKGYVGGIVNLFFITPRGGFDNAKLESKGVTITLGGVLKYLDTQGDAKRRRHVTMKD